MVAWLLLLLLFLLSGAEADTGPSDDLMTFVTVGGILSFPFTVFSLAHLHPAS